MSNAMGDLRFALRQLGRSPGFAVTAILTLALGIGANTAIFSLLDQALLRSLPVREPQQMVVLRGTGKAWEGHTSNHGGGEDAYFSYPMYRSLLQGAVREAVPESVREAAHGSATGRQAGAQREPFAGMIATAPADVGFSYAGSAQLARAELVSGNYFTVLGVKPALGHLLSTSDDSVGSATPVTVLSYEFWRDRLGADARAIGSTIAINGHPFVIAGVTAQGFRSAVWGEAPGFFVPMSSIGAILPGKDKRLTDHTDRWLNVLARMQPGGTRAQAQVALAPLWYGLRADELKQLGHHAKRFTDEYLTHSRLLVEDGARGFSYSRKDFEKPLLAMMAMALLVLVMASVNVASLLLVRAAGRAREFSLRYALGAGGTRIVQQLLLEGLLIGVGGGVLGMGLAPVAARILIHQLAGDEATVAFSATVDARLLLFNFVIALGVSVVFSLAPALQLRKPDLTASMRQQSGTGTGAALSFRRGVVCLQIGLSVVLLVGAGLFVRTMQKLHSVDVGFNTQHLVTFGINPKLSGIEPAAVPALQQRTLDTLAALPGVQAVSATNDPELAGNGQGGNVTVGGYTAPSDESFDVEEPSVSPDFFRTMQIPLLAGRLFIEADDASHPKVAIVNEAFAKHFCGSAAACIGRRMANGAVSATRLDTEIVGVMRDTRHEGVRSEVSPTWYKPLKQDSESDRLFIYLRTLNDPAQQLTTVRTTMHRLNGSLALVALRTMETQIDDNLSNERMIALLAVAFGGLATVLAGVGLYGVLAYATAQRTREIGIRIALGSSREAIARIVLVDVLILALVGITVAVPVTYGLSHLLESQLFGVSSADPVSLLAAVLLITSVAVVAALIPALRAALVDPMRALRTE